MLALSKGPNKVDVSLPLPEDGNRSVSKILCLVVINFRTMDKVHKPSDSGKFIA
jgi:hypothetical protein